MIIIYAHWFQSSGRNLGLLGRPDDRYFERWWALLERKVIHLVSAGIRTTDLWVIAVAAGGRPSHWKWYPPPRFRRLCFLHHAANNLILSLSVLFLLLLFFLSSVFFLSSFWCQFSQCMHWRVQRVFSWRLGFGYALRGFLQRFCLKESNKLRNRFSVVMSLYTQL